MLSWRTAANLSTAYNVVAILQIIISQASCLALKSAKAPVLLHQFPNGTWVENILTLSSGQVLVTLLNSAQIVLLDPVKPQIATLVYQSHSNTALLGIAQPDQNSIAVVYGNISSPQQISTPGSFGIELLSLRSNGTVSPKARFPVTGARMLDGLTSLPHSSRYLLSADPVLGLIWRVDTQTGSVRKAITSSLLQPLPNTSTTAVNGIQVLDSFLYFTNSNIAKFGRIEISEEGLPTSQNYNPGQILTQDFDKATYDDFALGPVGTNDFYLCSPTGFSINKFDLGTGQQTIFAGGPDYQNFDHPIAARLGKAPKYRNTLFVTTAGIIPGVGGNGGGQIFTIDLE